MMAFELDGNTRPKNYLKKQQPGIENTSLSHTLKKSHGSIYIEILFFRVVRACFHLPPLTEKKTAIDTFRQDMFLHSWESTLPHGIFHLPHHTHQ
jgi:hypothetical protein